MPDRKPKSKIKRVNFDEIIKDAIFPGNPVNDQYEKGIALLCETYQALMDAVEFFCQNPSRPDVKLNHFYLALDKQTWDIINELRLYDHHNIFRQYVRPFTNMFSAEEECKGKISWNDIRPKMSAMFGQIESIHQQGGAGNVTADPNKRKLIDDARLYLSGLKEKVNEDKKELKGETAKKQSADTFTISVKDREIWVNQYLIAKPHAVGTNYEFFEYIRSKPTEKIERKSLPSKLGASSLKERMGGKRFVKTLNELGFKGEILKAFFPKRGKGMLIYRGDKITKADLEKSGVKMPLFLKELEVAHTKHSPE